MVNFSPAREIDQARTRFLKDLFNSHGLTTLEPCLDPYSEQHAGACLYLATFRSCAAVDRAREEWHGAEFDNAFMTRIFIDDIDEDYTIPSLLGNSPTPTLSKACIQAAAFVPAPPSNTFEEWWAKRDPRHWAFHQRNIEHQTNLRYRGVWLYQSYPEGRDPTSFSRMTPPFIENEEDGRGYDEVDEPVELIDWPSWQTTRRFTLLPHTTCLVPAGRPASDLSSPQSSDDDNHDKKSTPSSSPPPHSPCLHYGIALYAAEELAQKGYTDHPAFDIGNEAQGGRSGPCKRATSSSDGSSFEETTSQGRQYADEEFTQTEQTTHSAISISRGKQAWKFKYRKRAAPSSDGTAIDGVSLDNDDRKLPFLFIYAKCQHPKGIITPQAQFEYAQTSKYTDDSPRSLYNSVRAYLPTPDASPAALQSGSGITDIPAVEAVVYQYPHFARIPSGGGDVHNDQSTFDTRSPASEATATLTPEVDDHAHYIRPYSTSGEADYVSSSQFMVLHQPIAIRVGTATLIKSLLENESSYSFEMIENISTQNTVDEKIFADPAEAWHAELAAKAASGEIEVEQVSASWPHQAHNDLSLVHPQHEWFAEILADHEINNDVVHDVPDYPVREDHAVQAIAVSAPEVSTSSEFIIEEAFAEPETIGGIIRERDTRSSFAPEENIAEIAASEEPALAREAIVSVLEDLNVTATTDVLNHREGNAVEIIMQPSTSVINETPDLWLKLLLLLLMAFFSHRLMLELLQSPMLAIALILLPFVYIRNGGNGCAEQQIANYECGS